MVCTSGARPQASEAKSRIYNFKKSENDPKQQEPLRHIEHNRRQFANDLEKPIAYILQRSTTIGLAFVPTSKHPQDPSYSKRFEIVCQHLKKVFGQKICLGTPIENIQSRESSSIIGGKRDKRYVRELKSNFKWLGLKHELEILIILDDVIRTGAHFIALKESIMAKSTKPPVMIGLF